MHMAAPTVGIWHLWCILSCPWETVSRCIQIPAQQSLTVCVGAGDQIVERHMTEDKRVSPSWV